MLFWIIVALFSLPSVSAMELKNKPGNNVFDVVYEEHMRALTKKSDQSQPSILPPFNTVLEDCMNIPPAEGMQQYLDYQLNLVPSRKLERVCQLLKYTNDEKEHTIIPADMRHDLNVLEGDYNSPAECLVNKIDRTSTTAGKVTLCATLLQPVQTETGLHTRSKQIQSVLQHLPALKEQLNTAGASENGFLSFYVPRDHLYTRLDRQKIRLPLSNNIQTVKALEDYCNNDELVLFCQELLPYFNIPTRWIIAATGGAAMYNQLPPAVTQRLNPNAQRAMLTGIVAYQVYQEAAGLNQVAIEFDWRKHEILAMQKKLMELGKFTTAITNIHKIVSSLPAMQSTAKLLQLKNPDAIGKLTELLQANTFKGEPSTLSHIGRIKLAYMLMHEHRAGLLSAYAALGNIDFLANSALLQSQNPSRFTFPVYHPAYLQDTTLIAQNYWNPFLDPEKAVANDITLDTPTGPRILFVTGKNARGKTTNSTHGIPLAILMAQTTGIAPAEKFEMHPAMDIVTMIKCASNIGENRSLFQETAHRAGKVLRDAKSAKHPTFIALDEPFAGGTNRDLAEKAAIRLVEEISKNPQVIGVVTTHFAELTQLASKYPDVFKNLQATNDYKLLEGIGEFDLQAAISVLEKETDEAFAQSINDALHGDNN